MERLKSFNELKEKAYSGDWQKRIISELEFLLEISKAKGFVYDAEILAQVDRLLKIYNENGAITKADVLETEDALSGFSAMCREYDVSCIAHAHIDMNWMWGLQETACITVDTFRTMLKLMDEYPDFTFSQSQASVYRIIEKYYPEMLEQIKKRVKEGRWEITASSWVENDKNMSGSEAMARHILYTKQYLSKLFDISEDDLQIDFEPDTFGHNENMPEILSKGGVKYYYHCRAFEGENIYNWEAPSGARVLVFREPTWYIQTIDSDLFLNVPSFCEKYKTKQYLKVYGVGDHGGGPTRRDIERLIDMSTWPLQPTIHFSTLKDYFNRLEKDRDNFNTVKRELNYVFTGCYTSQSRIKRANKIGEDRLIESEMLDAMARLSCDGYKTQSSYEKAWRKILFNQFHDILPGSGMTECREYALGEFQKALTTADINARHAMETICANIDTSSVRYDSEQYLAMGAGTGFETCDGSNYKFPCAESGKGNIRIYNLFNTSAVEKTSPVEITLWDFAKNEDSIIAEDMKGNSLDVQVMQGDSNYWGHRFMKISVFVRVPAAGYTTVVIRKQRKEKEYKESDQRDTFSDANRVLENDLIRAEFTNETMELASLKDKTTGKEYINKDDPSCSLRFIYETMTHGASAWRVGVYAKVENINRETAIKITDEVHGDLISFIKYRLKFKNSTADVTVSLDKGSSMLKFFITPDWREFGTAENIPQLQFYAPVDCETPVSRCAIPFGTIDRPQLDHDVPCIGFMAVPDGNGKAAALMSDCKYGFRNTGNGMLLDLVRSSYDPDKTPDIGIHPITVCFGITGYGKSELFDEYSRFVNPVSVYSNTVHGGCLPEENGIISVKGAQLIAVKNAEDGSGLVARILNPEDTDATAEISIPKAIAKASAVSVTESEKENITASGNTAAINVKAHSVETVKICF